MHGVEELIGGYKADCQIWSVAAASIRHQKRTESPQDAFWGAVRFSSSSGAFWAVKRAYL